MSGDGARLSHLRNAAWLLAGLLLGLALAWLLVLGLPRPGLRVVAGEPARAGLVGAHGPLRLRFSQPLAAAVPDRAVMVDSRTPGSLDVDGEWLEIRPAQALAAGEEHRIQLGPELLAANGDILGQAVSWPFEVRPAQIVFLQPAVEAWRLQRTTADEALLLSGERQVSGFSVAPDGETLVYSASNRRGGADLWWVDRDGAEERMLLDCGADRCLDPDWAPAGDRIAFTRRSDTSSADGPRLWTIGVDDGDAAPLYQDEARLGLDPVWSPDGLRLAYYDPSVQGVRILDLDSVSEQVLPTASGVSGAWSPDGSIFLFPVTEFEGELPLSALYRLDLQADEVAPLLRRDQGWRQVGVPAWSPNGDWLALTAQRSGAGPTQVMWRLRADGTGATALADRAGFSYGGPDWDPWGEQLLFQRLPLGGSAPSPDLMIWSEAGGVELRLNNAGLARWVP